MVRRWNAVNSKYFDFHIKHYYYIKNVLFNVFIRVVFKAAFQVAFEKQEGPDTEW